MNSQKILNIIFGIALCFITYLLVSKKSKVACIDNTKVISSYSGIEQAAKKLQVKELELKAKADTLAREFEVKLKEYEKKKSSMNNSELGQAENELKMMQEKYQQYNSINDDKFKKEQYAVTEKAIEEINKIIHKYAKEKGYSVVLGANSSGSVVYVDETIDITEDIITILKEAGK